MTRPYVIKKPNTISKLKLLGGSSQFDTCGYPSLFTPLEKAADFNLRPLPLKADGGLKPLSAPLDSKHLTGSAQTVRERSSLTGFTSSKKDYSQFTPLEIPNSIGKTRFLTGFIYSSVGEGGRCVRLFKVLQTNYCEGNCLYCANRRDRDFFRMKFSPLELASIFMEYYKKRLVEGFFLSSSIDRNPDRSQEAMIQTLEILRNKFSYSGYVHCVILPGVDRDLIKEVSKFSDRLSINLEAPGQAYLNRLSPSKDFSGLISGLKEISQLDKFKPLKAGISTQLVVGAAGEKDCEILNLAGRLYKNYRLWRVYYSGFSPIDQTPLENLSACSPWRNLRLYQADFLLRKYGFGPEELPFDDKGNLPLGLDPKLAWAQRHKERFPIEINRASLEELMRVPGIGRISAGRILQARHKAKIATLEELRKLGASVKRAKGFITLNGKSL